MRKLIIALLTFSALSVNAQTLFVSPDTTHLIFPSEVSISILRPVNGTKNFQISSGNLTILLTEMHFLLNRLRLEEENAALYRANESILKSSVEVVQKKYEAELERTLLHKNAFESLEKVSASYQAELLNCKADLKDVSRENANARRSGFIRGLIWGAIVGGILGIVVDAAVR